MATIYLSAWKDFLKIYDNNRKTYYSALSLHPTFSALSQGHFYTISTLSLLTSGLQIQKIADSVQMLRTDLPSLTCEKIQILSTNDQHNGKKRYKKKV